MTCYESVLNCCGTWTGCLRAWAPCFCCCCPYPYTKITQGNVGLREKFGRFEIELTPGLHYINPCTDRVIPVSLRTMYSFKPYRVLDLQRQLILTKDNITVNIDTVVYYRVIDPKKACYRVSAINASVCEITYATLRTVCGEHTLQELLEKRQ
jgi:erythrocyte band 7 integral membrane protein